MAPTADEFAEIFSEWNQGELNSYLIEITARIFTKNDAETGKPIVDLIVDKAGQKGTGKWTVGHATEMAVPLSTIASAVEARIISSVKAERVEAALGTRTAVVNPFTGMTVAPHLDESALPRAAPGLLLACGLSMRSTRA